MNLIEKATVMHYHRHRIAEYSDGTVRALGWKGEESQHKRFAAIATVGELGGCSLLDLGCGYGGLKGYLDQKFSNFSYIGIDQMPEFIAKARTQYGRSTDTSFFQTDFTTAILPQVDYVIASGALGYRCDDPDFCTDMIHKMYAAATKALAFNMLDAAFFPEHKLLVGYDFEKVVALCESLSPHVKVIRGYLEDDFTVFMYRERQAPSHAAENTYDGNSEPILGT